MISAKKSYLIALLLLLSYRSPAQNFSLSPDLRFENYNGTHNFVGNFTTTIIRSKSGYVWVGSNGLYRFDGKNYERYSYILGEDRRFNDYEISDLKEDPYGRIWLGCKSGLCYFDQYQNKFHDIDTTNGPKVVNAYGFSIIGDSLWFLCKGGLSLINLKTLKVNSIPSGFLFGCQNNFSLDNNTLISCGENAYYLYHIREQQWEQVPLGNETGTTILSVAKAQGRYWFGTTMGLWVADDIHKPATYIEGTKDLAPYDLKVIPALTGDSILWIGSFSKGLIVFNLNQKKAQYSYVRDADNPYSILSNGINSIFVDDKNMLWMATDNGISLFNYANQSLKEHFFYDKKVMKAVQDKYDPNNLWLAIIEQGFVKMDWPTKREISHYYPMSSKKGQRVPVANIYDMLQLSKDKWLLLSTEFLILWDSRTGSEKEIPFPNTKIVRLENIIPYNSDSCFITGYGGLFAYNVKAEKAEIVFQRDTVNKKSGFNELYNGRYDGKNSLWIGSRRGLAYYNIQKGERKIYKVCDTPERTNFIQDLDIAEHEQKIICASSGGVAVFDVPTKKFTLYDQVADVKNPRCRRIVILDSIAWVNFSGGILNMNLHTWATNVTISNEQYFSTMQTLAIVNNEVFVPMRNRFAYFTPDLINNLRLPTTPIIERVVVNGKVTYFPDKPLSLKYNENIVSFHVSAFAYDDPDHVLFRYKLEGSDSTWNYAGENRDVNFMHLPCGKYSFLVQAGNTQGNWNDKPARFSFEIVTPFWQTIWFRLLMLSGFVALVLGIATMRVRSIKRREEENTKTKIAISEMELKALRSQMNPHFIFNSLNSIQKFIWENKQEDAAEYLTKFSRLIRMILDNSMHKWITLEQELTTLTLYLELEHRRCNNKFDYYINIDNKIETTTILFPPLILQPYVENAIWHGLLNKESRGELKITITKESENMIRCIIEDDGIGRAAAGKLKEQRSTKTGSYGIQITNQRLAMLNENGKKGEAVIKDLYDENGMTTGTKVIITFPISNFVKI